VASATNPLAGLHFATPSAKPYGVIAMDGGQIDAALGGGLALGVLHEFTATGIEAEHATASTAFLLPLLARLPDTKPIFWLARVCDLYPPGLMCLGLDPARLIQLHAVSDNEALACAETLLRAGIANAVVAEVGHAGKLAGRRLQLACLEHGTSGFVLRRFPYGVGTRTSQPLISAITRWRIAPAASAPYLGEPGETRLQAELLHARGGVAGSWIVEPQETGNAAHPFRLVAALANPPQNLQRRLAS